MNMPGTRNKIYFIGCSLVLIFVALSSFRYLDISPHQPIAHSFTAADLTETLEPAQLLLLGEKIDINAANEKAFQVLYRIGPVLAARIVEDRAANGPFVSIDDLQRVYGIGPLTIQKNRHHLKADARSN